MGYNNMKQWYEELFENYGMRYDNECFTQGTIGECDFIEKEIDYDKGLRILGAEQAGMQLNWQKEAILLWVSIFQIRN